MKHTMIIEINTSKMDKEGIYYNLDSIKETVSNIKTYKITNEGFSKENNYYLDIFTTDSNDAEWLTYKLEQIPWFMKYVIKWESIDDGMFSDVIAVEREMGELCSYG